MVQTPKKRTGLLPGILFAVLMVGVFFLASLAFGKMYVNFITRGYKDDTLYANVGKYPQECILGYDLTAYIINAEYNLNGVATLGDSSYQRIPDLGQYKYYKLDNIIWRVLSSDDNTALLLSEYIIDSRMFSEDIGSDWEHSTMRSYLNGYSTEANSAGKDFSADGDSFISKAFSRREQSALLPIGEDKVCLLSLEDALASSYGFSSERSADSKRIAFNTSYAVLQGVSEYTAAGNSKSNGFWFLGSADSPDNCFSAVNYSGEVIDSSKTADYIVGIRPLIRVDLKILEKIQK